MRRYARQGNYIAVKGFSLMELMVVVSIVGILSAVSLPSFSRWIQDAKTRTTAEALQNGIRLAQVEALKNGAPVQFFLTSDNNPTLNSTPSASGTNWGIQVLSTTIPNSAVTFVQGASLGDNNDGVVMTTTKPTIIFNSIGRLVTFNASGQLIGSSNATYSLSNPTLTNARQLNVVVSSTGSVRMCDPSKARATSADGC